MAVPQDQVYQELTKVLASRLKQNCTPEVKAALDQCWISQWQYNGQPLGLGNTSETLLLQVLVLHSSNSVAISRLRDCWQEVLTAWQNLTGSLTYIALFQISTDDFFEDLQPILFESAELVENQ